MYNVNDRVVVVNYDAMPHNSKSRAIGRICGKHGVVVDRMYSAATKQHYYRVQLDEYPTVSTIKFSDDMLQQEKTEEFNIQISIVDSVVIARMFSPCGQPLSEGHGHIFNGTSSDRIAQAASYACRRMWNNLKLSNKK